MQRPGMRGECRGGSSFIIEGSKGLNGARRPAEGASGGSNELRSARRCSGKLLTNKCLHANRVVLVKLTLKLVLRCLDQLLGTR